MNEDIGEALARAKWNESVLVNIDDGSGGASSMLLVPKLDRENGGIRWEDAMAGAGASPATAAAIAMEHHILTKIWMFPMLNDERRNAMYETAIQRASEDVVAAERQRQKQQQSIDNIGGNGNGENNHRLGTLDIGSGTGLLALLSSKYLREAWTSSTAAADATETPNAMEFAVTSLEMAGPMADVAKKTVALEKEFRSHEEGKEEVSKARAIATAEVTVIEGHSGQHPPMRGRNGGGGGGDDPPPVRLCTSELLESGLLGEGWLPAMRDAWDRHLLEGAVVLPAGARVYARLVSGISGFVGPHSCLAVGGEGTEPEAPAPNPLPLSRNLRLFTTAAGEGEGDGEGKPSPEAMGMLSDGSYDPISGQKHGVQVEIHADRYLATGSGRGNACGSGSIIRPLSDPIESLDLDVTSPDSIPSPDPSSRSPRRLRFVATDTGRAEGVLFWWELDLYKASESKSHPNLTYTTHPGSDFQDHWHQCLYVFPKGGPSSLEVERGKEYTLLASHTDSRVHFSLRGDTVDRSDGSNDSKRPRPTIPTETVPVVTPRRCWQLNDADRSAKFRDGIRVALQNLREKQSSTGVVLDVSDFSLCGILASLLRAGSVTSVESGSSGLPLAAARVAQIGNSLPLDGSHRFQIVRCHAESLTEEVFKTGGDGDGEDQNHPDPGEDNGVVNLVVGEPYYEMLEGWPIETALNYFYTIRMLKRKKIVRHDALCVPARAVVLACGIQCEDIGRSYRKDLGAPEGKPKHGKEAEPRATVVPHIGGFDHQPIVDCWSYDRHGIPLPLWEYNGVVQVTEVVELGVLDYETDSFLDGPWATAAGDTDRGSNPREMVQARFSKPSGTCHAIAFWVDYEIRMDDRVNDDRNDDGSGVASRSPPFATVSTGFDPDGPKGSSCACAERQIVRILSPPLPVEEGGSLPIPLHDLGT
ncbi:unnamed protein product [Pseudo-nitzschia multistriata]|uniref:Protein arginine N-methyltransferase n=1 Tax=Pseudo-nitzschia multistriata TaxID=183589 RepID=A0A448YWJ7_9STRA|nr:unnamed protein product [Pseudo-nitzschia multistriata]